MKGSDGSWRPSQEKPHDVLTNESNSHPGKVTAPKPVGLISWTLPEGRAMIARGKWRDHSGKGQGEFFVSLTTEKMLSAIGKMSNIFLQTGQNIDITHKNRALSRINFGS
jgi:hypothetical protein